MVSVSNSSRSKPTYNIKKLIGAKLVNNNKNNKKISTVPILETKALYNKMFKAVTQSIINSKMIKQTYKLK